MLNRDDIAHEYILSGVATTVHSAFQLADAMIAEAQKRKSTERPSVVGDGWISVESECPPMGIRVMFYDTEVGVCSGRWNGVCWYLDGERYTEEHAKVTHWQDLPSPPKEVK